MAISAPSSSKEIFYGPDLVEIAKPFKLSTHDELEITCINRAYPTEASSTLRFSAAVTWLNTGTHESLLEAYQFVRTIQHHHGFKVACLEEVAHRNGWMNAAYIQAWIHGLGNTSYAEYLQALL